MYTRFNNFANRSFDTASPRFLFVLHLGFYISALLFGATGWRYGIFVTSMLSGFCFGAAVAKARARRNAGN